MLDFSRGIRRRLLGTVCALAMLSIACAAYCDTPVTMAPPVEAGGGSGDAGANAAASSVFNWQEIPVNQNVPITRAVFDRGGYQLYDNAGETIVVPFTNDNLYVMKFAVSPDGSTYFVNTGSVPVLYLPEGGYLDNASDPSAHWYPFTPKWHPTTPVFVGIAPSWNDYVAMGWYPDMVCYGGYWCNGPFISVGAVFPAFGLFFEIGGAHYWGWGPYWNYCGFHPAPFHLGIYNANFYRWGGPGWHNYAGFQHPFIGAGHPFVPGRGFIASSGRTFLGAGHPMTVGTRFVGGPNGAGGFRGTAAIAHGFQGGAHSFNGAAHTFQGTGHTFNGASHTFSGGSHTFSGASHSFSGGSRTFNGGSHAFTGASHSFSGGSRSFSGGHSFQGASFNHSFQEGGSHSFQGSSAHFAGASHSFGGGGGHSFQGGGHPGSDNHSHN